MSNIEVSKIIEPIPASDGAGVKLKRSIGVEPNYFDPFLMLDEFGSENSEDYIAGFPPHPHRDEGGVENLRYSPHYFLIQIHQALKKDQNNLAQHQYFFLILLQHRQMLE